MTDTSESPRQKWLPGMKSPNPAGRPKGIVDKRQKLQRVFTDHGIELVEAVVNKALDGDVQAMGIALARVAPPIRAQAERVQFALDHGVSLSDQASQILFAVSEGLLDADTGRILIDCIQAVAGIRAVEDLENRIIQLEAKAVN